MVWWGMVGAAPCDLDEVKAFVARDQQGGSAPYQHCALCPLPDAQPCVKACSNERTAAQQADGIKVTYP